MLEFKLPQSARWPLFYPIAKARWVPFFSPLTRGEDGAALANLRNFA